MADVEVKTHVDAPPERVWALLGDPTRMGEWSPECQRVTWKSGNTQPALGAKFKGRNALGWRKWSTTGTVVEWEPSKRIGWDVKAGPMAVSHWGYRIDADPDGGGCTVIESFDDHRSGWMKLMSRPVRGVSDVVSHNRKGMEDTLARVKAVAEQS
jgi:uncharacterized protein YndB with AHSA1/START domain